jgi:hypothetical protein
VAGGKAKTSIVAEGDCVPIAIASLDWFVSAQIIDIRRVLLQLSRSNDPCLYYSGSRMRFGARLAQSVHSVLSIPLSPAEQDHRVRVYLDRQYMVFGNYFAFLGAVLFPVQAQGR